MSQTISVGVVGPSYWSYMATVMAECLEKIIQVKRIESGDLPKGVYNDAHRFFSLVLQAAGNTLPENPPASINAYVIAADAVRSFQSAPQTRQELEKCLEHYLRFTDGMQQLHDLNKEEVKTAEGLRKFFLWLQQQGEAEVSKRSVHFEAPPTVLLK